MSQTSWAWTKMGAPLLAASACQPAQLASLEAEFVQTLVRADHRPAKVRACQISLQPGLSGGPMVDSFDNGLYAFLESSVGFASPVSSCASGWRSRQCQLSCGLPSIPATSMAEAQLSWSPTREQALGDGENEERIAASIMGAGGKYGNTGQVAAWGDPRAGGRFRGWFEC